MRKANCAACFLFFSAILYGQADGINVTATKTVEMAPEEVTFNLAVLVEPNSSLDEVLLAVKDTGLAAKDLTGIGSQPYGPGPNQTRLAYQFILTVPFSKFKETLDKLAAVRRSLVASDGESDLQTYFIAIGASEAAREQARQRVIPDLIANARGKGQSLAAAAGLSLGAIQGVFDSSSAVGSIYAAGPYFGGPSALKITFLLLVRFAVK